MYKQILAGLVFLAGCAGWKEPPPPQPIYTPEQQEKADQKFDQDERLCRREAAQSNVSAQRGYSVETMMINDTSGTYGEFKILKLCMEARGHPRYPKH